MATGTRTPATPVYPVANVAALSASLANRFLDGDLVRTAGYTTAGDGGGDTFVYRATGRPTADLGWYHNGPGADDYYASLDAGRIVDAKKFGCKGDNSTDDTARAQAAIDAAKTANAPCYFPPGRYVLSDTLWLTGSISESDDTAYHRCNIYGAGSGYGNSSTLYRTTFVCSSVNQPATAIQRARQAVLADIQIIGPNVAPESQNATDSDRADWLTASVTHTQYAPQCGLAIDPTLAANPGSGYSGRTYVGSSEGSNGITLRNVAFRNHAVGLCVRPDGGLANVDQLRLENVQSDHCATALGIGNSQTRASSLWSHIESSNCHTTIDTRTFGDGQGVLPTINGLQVGTTWRVFNANVAFGTSSITGLHAESINWLGILGEGTATGRQVLEISGGTIKRLASLDETTACPLFMATSRLVKFTAVTIEQGHQDADLLSIGGTMSPVFDCCHFANTNSTAGVRVVGMDLNGTTVPIMRHCTVRVDGGTYPFSVDAMDRGVTRGVANNNGNRLWIARTTGLFRTGSSRSLETIKYAEADWRTRDTTASSIGVTAGVLNFDTTDQPFWLVGDYIYGNAIDPTGELPGTHIVPLFKVTTVAATMAARVIGDASWITAFSNIQAVQPEWAPIVDFQGDTTSSSPTITNTTHDGVVEVGDWITGSGIPSNTRVTAVDDGANTITLSRNATATATGVSLYWGQLHAVTTTAVF